ncbi:MAG: hypothetical protein BWY68_00534 [bacterium ADurb.Bin400]|nr:MAG: hypothetical protein BWY68_00534 [bacterium ADurb.Bin400]
MASGSGDGNSFAIGIEIVGGTVNTPPADIERELMDNTTQYQAVLNTVKYLVETYNIPNVIGNKENLDMKRGIFGHLQTQSRNGSWEGLSKGCRGAKNDPGPNYMKRVWADLGSTGDSCI